MRDRGKNKEISIIWNECVKVGGMYILELPTIALNI
jgi:hypothetical protein